MYELGDMLTPLLLLITFFFFFNDTATTEIYTLSLHDALPISRDILVCEQEGDRITHDIIHRLNQTFVTPIDREDILELVKALDDVVDLTEEVADFLVLYKIEAPMEQAQKLARILHDATKQVAEAMPRMRAFDDISHYVI